jgi:hypothetical protein
MMAESTNVPFRGVGKGGSDCDDDGDGNSDSGGNTFNNQQMLQVAMEWRGGMTVEEGAMMTTTESMNVPFGWQWRCWWQWWRRQWRRWQRRVSGNRNRDCHCNGIGNGKGNSNSISGSNSGNDDGDNKEGNEDKSKPGLGEGSALLTRRMRETTPTAVPQAV